MDIKTLIKRVRELAAKNPDATYRFKGSMIYCYYGKGEAGNGVGCIFGQAWPELKIYDVGNPYTIGRILIVEDMDCHQREIDWCNEVQSCQDCGETWKEAIEAADKCCPLD